MKATNLGKTPSYCFYMVWSYLPTGVQLTTGSWDRVSKHLKNFPTHHANVHQYNYHRVTSKSWSLLGKHVGYKQHKKYEIEMYKIQNLRMSYYSSNKYILKSSLYNSINTNHTFIIALKDSTIPNGEDQCLYMKSYRKLPKAYMKDWEDINKIMKVLV